MEIRITVTTENDFSNTEYLTRDVFWNLFKPGCDEHLVLNKLRKSHAYIPELDLVSWDEDHITGHIISTKAVVMDKNGFSHEVLCAGPLSVREDLQHHGIGSALMLSSIERAKALGYRGIVLYGNPGYYHRFGFQDAANFGISTSDGLNFSAFMVLELFDNALQNVTGRFFESEAFKVDEEELNTFELKFPFREKGPAKINLNL